MTNDQERHLADIQKEFIRMVEIKYRRGAEEHGGDLQDMTEGGLLDSAIEEAIDLFVYLITLRGNLL